MGSEFMIVNPDKRQYFDPGMFGELATHSGYMRGLHATALAMLVCDHGGGAAGGPLAGTWSGDRVLAIFEHEPPDTHGITTSTHENPHRNLYEVSWREFIDIGPKATRMICNWIDGTADKLASRVVLAPIDGELNLDEYLLWRLGEAAIDESCFQLERSLAKYLGPEWKTIYNKVKTEWDAMKQYDYE